MTSGHARRINAALNGLSYVPTANYNGPATLRSSPATGQHRHRRPAQRHRHRRHHRQRGQRCAGQQRARGADDQRRHGAASSRPATATSSRSRDVDAGSGRRAGHAHRRPTARLTPGRHHRPHLHHGDGTGDATMTFTGTLGRHQRRPGRPDATPHRQLQRRGHASRSTTNDQGNTGSGGPLDRHRHRHHHRQRGQRCAGEQRARGAVDQRGHGAGLLAPATRTSSRSAMWTRARPPCRPSSPSPTARLSLSGVAGLTFVGGANGTATMTVRARSAHQHRHGRHELRPHGQLQRPGHPHHRHQRPGQHRRRRPAHRHRHGHHHRQRGERCADARRGRGYQPHRARGLGHHLTWPGRARLFARPTR